MSILHKLMSYYDINPVGSLANEVSGRILDNLIEIKNMNLEELSEKCNVSPSTLSRQIKTFSGLSYNQFRKEIVDNLSSHSLGNFSFNYGKDFPYSFEGYISCIQFYLNKLLTTCTEEKINKCVDLIHEHHTVRLYIEFAGSVMKRQFQTDLAVTGKRTVFLSTIDEWEKDLPRIGPDTVLLVCNCYEPTAFHFPDYLHLIEKAHENGASVIALNGLYRPSLRKFSDIQLDFENTNTAMDHTLVDAIINSILIAYRRKYIV